MDKRLTPVEEGRRSGRTKSQMLAAKQGSYYLWVNPHLYYPIELARSIGRTDLTIVDPQWIEDGRWHGLELRGLVVDHACELTERQSDNLKHAFSRVRP